MKSPINHYYYHVFVNIMCSCLHILQHILFNIFNFIFLCLFFLTFKNMWEIRSTHWHGTEWKNTLPQSLCHLVTGCRWNAHFRLMGTWICQVNHVKACLNQIKIYGYQFSTQSIITCSCHLWWNRWHFQRRQMCHLRVEEEIDIEERLDNILSRTRWERKSDRERAFIYSQVPSFSVATEGSPSSWAFCSSMASILLTSCKRTISLCMCNTDVLT